MPSRRDGPPSIWDTAWYIGKRFCRSSWRIGADQRSDWYGPGSGELLAAAQNNREDDFKGLHSMNFREEDSSKIKILLWNLLARIQELQNEIHCMNDSRDSQDAEHKDPEHIDYSAPRLARYLQNAWKRHQDAVFWVDIDLGIKEGLMFYQTRSNSIILQGTLPAHCIVKVERLKNGEKLYERQYLSLRPPPKISLKHDLNWSKGNDQGSTVEHQPVGKLVQQSLGEALPGSSKPTQFPKPIEDRTGQLVTQEIVSKLQGDLSSSDRAGQPAKEGEKRVLKSHDRTEQPVEGRLHKVQEDGYLKNRDDADKFNLAMDDENIDFNISGVPDAMVKRSQSISGHDFDSENRKSSTKRSNSE